jgi:cystathionine beta-lyase
MGKYDFDAIVDRHGTSCLKYDFGMQRKGRTDLLPLWVADMDFKLPEEILADFHKRIDHGIFGYTDPDQEYYAALDGWFSRRHGYHIDPKTVTVGCGVVYGLATGVKAFTQSGDAILIQQPVYYPFREVIEDNGRKFINNQLIYKDGKYSIDFADFEAKIVANKVKVFILCNPHNPVGRVWSKEELGKMGDICLKHNVIIMDDEIHCDFVFPGHKFTSFMTLDKKYQDNLVLYNSPSKTFNVAGLQPANIIIKNEKLRTMYRKANAASGYSQGNIMGMIAVKSVYTKGDAWVDELVKYITGNMEYVRDFVKKNLPKAYFVEPEGTYLIWIDFSGYGFTSAELENVMVDEAKLWLDSGKVFGPATEQFQRFNLACPRSTVEQAMKQLKAALDMHK